MSSPVMYQFSSAASVRMRHTVSKHTTGEKTWLKSNPSTWEKPFMTRRAFLQPSDFMLKTHRFLMTFQSRGRCHAPNMFGTVDIGIMSPVFRKLKSFFKNIFIGLEHLELRKRKIADIIPHAGYYEFKQDSDANDMTVQQYYCKTYNIHIK